MMGDSLAGRFFQYRLHPLDLKEVRAEMAPQEALDRLLRLGGFPEPEPFLDGGEAFYGRWKKSRQDIILRQDLLDLESVSSISDVENIARALLKEPKYYFYDTGQVLGDAGGRLEDVVAGALLKELHFLEDALGRSCGLHYLRDKEGREVDFLVTIDERPVLMVEVQWAEGGLSRSLPVFSRYLPGVPGVQLVGELEREKSFESGFRIVRATPWLADLNLQPYAGSAGP